VAEDWGAVARAISDRLADTRATQMDVASRAKVSLTTFRELQHNLNPRRRRPQTLAAISEALGWPTDYLARVLTGEDQPSASVEPDGSVLDRLQAVEDQLCALTERLAAVERSQRDR
jgi:hypothetical protein